MSEVMNRAQMQGGLYTQPGSRFSHSDRLSSVKMFIICCKQEQFITWMQSNLGEGKESNPTDTSANVSVDSQPTDGRLSTDALATL